MISYFKTFIFLFFFLAPTTIFGETSKEEIRFGVFSYLGYEKTKEKYQPLIDYLNTKLDKKVILEVLTQEELDEKIEKKNLI